MGVYRLSIQLKDGVRHDGFYFSFIEDVQNFVKALYRMYNYQSYEVVEEGTGEVLDKQLFRTNH